MSELAADAPAEPAAVGPAIEPAPQASLAPVPPASSKGRAILIAAACALVLLALVLKLAS